MFQIKIKNSAKNDLKKLQQSKLRLAFERIVKQLKQDPRCPNQGYEKLKPPLSGKYSRRLNLQHRVVYQIDDHTQTVYILSAWTHYE